MFSIEALDRMAKAIVREEAEKGVIKDLPSEESTTWLLLRKQFNMSSQDLIEYVPDSIYDQERDNKYNPMSMKPKGKRKKGFGSLEDVIANKESLLSMSQDTFINAPRVRRPQSSPWSGRRSLPTSSPRPSPTSKRWAHLEDPPAWCGHQDMIVCTRNHG